MQDRLPAGGVYNGEACFGFLLTPTPEPSTIALLVAGAACLLAFAWRRRSSGKIIAHLAVLVVALSTSFACADVFNMPNGETSVQFVTVGDPGNAADSTGYGSVANVYWMGKYDVTVGQYVQFLNAVAATDTYGLWDSNMGTDFPNVGIAQRQFRLLRVLRHRRLTARA